MKNLTQLLSIIILASLPFLSVAQFSVGVMTAPISRQLTTKILVPIGVELKFSPTKSVVLEYGAPTFNTKGNQYSKRKAFSFSTELRTYKPTLTKRGFKRYYAFRFNHMSESYVKENQNHFTYEGKHIYRKGNEVYHYTHKNGETIYFNYAEVKSRTNGMSFKYGLQKTFKNKFIIDFNFGLGITNRTILYENVIERRPDYGFGLSGWDFQIKMADVFKGTFGQWRGDRKAGSQTYVTLPMSIRIGYLLFDEK